MIRKGAFQDHLNKLPPSKFQSQPLQVCCCVSLMQLTSRQEVLHSVNIAWSRQCERMLSSFRYPVRLKAYCTKKVGGLGVRCPHGTLWKY